MAPSLLARSRAPFIWDRQYVNINSPWKVGIGATSPVRTGDVRQSHQEFWLVTTDFVASDSSSCNSRCNWRMAPVAPGATGGHRRCAPAESVSLTGNYRKTNQRPQNLLQPIIIPSVTGGVCQIPTFHGMSVYWRDENEIIFDPMQSIGSNWTNNPIR